MDEAVSLSLIISSVINLKTSKDSLPFNLTYQPLFVFLLSIKIPGSLKLLIYNIVVADEE